MSPFLRVQLKVLLIWEQEDCGYLLNALPYFDACGTSAYSGVVSGRKMCQYQSRSCVAVGQKVY
jgi:hypothetical protein